MERRGKTDLHDLIIKSGELIICPQVNRLIAIAGSNVVVTFWHPQSNFVALANFSKPRVRPGNKNSTHFGNIALFTIIKHIENLNIPFSEVEANIIGGGRKYFHITTAEENVNVAKSILLSKGIEIVSEDVGGNKGRKVLFNTTNGQVALLKVQRLRHSDWL